MKDEKNTAATAGEVWSIRSGDAEFFGRLSTQANIREVTVLHGEGRKSILREPALGLICSVQCPGSVVIKTFDAVRELRDAGIVMAGGFHSPMENDCLDFLLRGIQPVIVCPGKGLAHVRVPQEWSAGIAAGRLLLLSQFDDTVQRTTTALAQARNELVAALSAAVLIPHASPGGKVEATARNILERGQPLFTFDDEANTDLIRQGARPYNLADVKQAVLSA
jgi:predicted Rossmann fold nucleotide-binding protein DprA/Smf involved in DNA uptake